MKIGDTKVRHQQQAVELRSKAQELKDAAGGEKIAALDAKKEVALHKDTYVVANASAKELQGEAAKLRADAAEKLKEAVGGRGLHALENVARGFGKLMAKLTGHRLETTVTLKGDPEAKAAADKLLALASEKDAAAQAKLSVATNAHAQATAALAKMEGHEKTAANHLAMASQLLVEAKGHDRTAMFAGAAQQAGAVVKSFFDDVKKDLHEIGSEVAKEAKAEVKLAWGDLKGALIGILRAGADSLVKAAVAFAEEKTGVKLPSTSHSSSHSSSRAKPSDDAAAVKKDIEAKAADVEKKRVFYVDSQGVATTTLPKEKPAAAKPEEAPKAPVAKAPVTTLPVTTAPLTKPSEPSFEPGKVSFGGARAPKAALPNIDAPLAGDKKATESLVALRWAAEASGIDWTGKGTGDLKAALSKQTGGLHVKNGASPFEVKARLMERLGLPAGKDRANVHTLDLGVVREEFAKRTALGMDRLLPKAELEAQLTKLGLEKDTSSSMIGMTSLVVSSQGLEAAKDDLKKDIKDTAKLAAFDARAKSLDTSKKAMLDVIKNAPAGERHVLALDSVDAVEVAHGKMGATTKLGFAVESLTQGKFADAFKKALGLDDAKFAAARNDALKASEWTTLGEMTDTAKSSTLAFPGPPDDAGRAQLSKLPAAGAKLAKDLGLLDGSALAALEDHLSSSGKSGGAQMLGLIRMLSSLSQRRDFRTKEQLSADEVHQELLKNTQPPKATVDAKLVSALQPLLADALKELR